MDGKSIISSSLLYYKQYFVVKSMNIPATKEEILENFKKNSNGRPLNKDDIFNWRGKRAGDTLKPTTDRRPKTEKRNLINMK